jgi:DNA-directed RNA polymerase specialized sigma24 family protein
MAAPSHDPAEQVDVMSFGSLAMRDPFIHAVLEALSQGLTLTEIAESLDVSLSDVRSARARLRSMCNNFFSW